MNKRQMLTCLLASGGVLWGLFSPTTLWCGLLPTFVILLLKRRMPGKRFYPLDWAVIGIAVCETILYFTSSYHANSAVAPLMALSLALLWLLWRQCVVDAVVKRVIVRFIAAIGALSAVLTLFFFLFYCVQIRDMGFSDLTQFRARYHPMGMLSNDWAGFLLAFFPFSLIAWIEAKQSYTWLWGAATVCIATAIMVSLSRGAVFALLFFIAVAFAALFRLRVMPNRRLFKGLALFSVSLLIICIPFRSALQTTFSVTGSVSHVRSIEGRFARWSDAMTLFAQHPLVGVGADNFALAAEPLSNQRETIYTGRCTNSWLQLAAEKGILGLAVYGTFGFLLIVFMFRILRKRDAARFGAVICVIGLLSGSLRECAFSTLWEKPSLLFLWVLLALQTAEDQNPQNAVKSRISLIFIAGMALLLCFGYINARHDGAIRHNRAFISAFNEGDTIKALTEVRCAVSLWPDNAMLQANSGLCQVNATIGAPTNDAFAAFERALVLQPNDAGFHAQLGMSFLLKGDTLSARQHLEKAVSLSPHEAGYRLMYASSFGDADSSLVGEHVAKALYASPDIMDSQWFVRWRAKFTTVANRAVSAARRMLSDSLHRYDTPQLKARMAKILLSAGSIDSADLLLRDATGAMPSLNRAWLMRGDIAALNNDSIAGAFYERAISLDGGDAYAQMRLGAWYLQSGDTAKAFGYCINGLNAAYKANSEHSLRSPSIYNISTLNNDFIPASFLHEIKPDIHPQQAAEIIVKGFEQEGNSRMAERYRQFTTGKTVIPPSLWPSK